jgi:hypothetical protein
MSMKTFIWGGMFAGSGIGSILPLLWDAGVLSMSSIVLSAVGGIVGIWAGYTLAKSLGL